MNSILLAGRGRNKKTALLTQDGFWWGMVDSNHRRRCQQIYSLSPLATREIPQIYGYSIGAGGRIRTPDLLITNQLLYQLSYTSISPANRIIADVPHIVNKKVYQKGEIHRFKGIPRLRRRAKTTKEGENTMTLQEISVLYDESAAQLSGRLSELRLCLRQTEDAEEARRLRRRIEELRPLLTQCRKLSGLTERYYDRSFYGYREYRI